MNDHEQARSFEPRPWVSRRDLLGVLILATVFVVWVGIVLFEQSHAGAGVRIQRGDAAAVEARVDVNSAPLGELLLLPGIGEVRAGRILARRAENGPLHDLAQLREATGLSERGAEALRGLVTFGPPHTE
jgi:DNA uptake protein ComE-like DNA-binding protein